MGVNHSLLPISDSELESLLAAPASIHALVERRADDVRRLLVYGPAIIALTSTREDDPLRFLQAGGPDAVSGSIGGEDDDEADMGYGPASYYRNSFVAQVAKRLEVWTVDGFAEYCDVELLDEHDIYPGNWRDPEQKEALIRSFGVYRDCVTSTARSAQNLLVWND